MGSVPSPTPFDVKKVAIIGAGPCGLSAAKYLKSRAAFDSIVIFEQRDQVGGVWNYSDLAPAACPVPQEDPFWGPEPPLRPDGAAHHQAPIFPSAMYQDLRTNLLGSLMEFSDQKFSEDAQLYPRREAVQDYLVRFAEDVRGLIRFCSRVKRVSLRPVDGVEKWHIEAASTVNDQVFQDTFDAVVVANGHYAVPHLPSVKGLDQFHKTHPSIITHSRQFRTPDPFKGKKVVVVGNGPSGLEIAKQINTVANKTFLSVRSATKPVLLAYLGCEEIAEIDEFMTPERGIRLKDGTTVTEIDHIIFCTGFFYSYPFLHEAGRDDLIKMGNGVCGLYKHIFYIKHPTIAFLGLSTHSSPWPLSEAEAAIISSVWSNNLTLPPAAEMEKWSQELEDKCVKKMHALPPPADGETHNELCDWNLKSTHIGKQPEPWTPEKFWQRNLFLQARLRWEELGFKATTLEELGYHYDPADEEKTNQ